MTIKQENAIADLFQELESLLSSNIVSMFNAAELKNIDKENIYGWVNKQNELITKLFSKNVKITNKTLKRFIDLNDELLSNEALASKKAVLKELNRLTDISQRQVDTQSLQDNANTIIKQAVQQNVFAPLLTETANNPAIAQYQDILRQATVDVATGKTTLYDSIKRSSYKMIDKGIKTTPIGDNGYQTTISNYTNMVVRTNAHKLNNDIRMDTFDKYDVTLAYMDFHPSARPACAPIQGHIVNTVPESDPRYNSKFDSIYNHGYGTPAGTQGIDCKHNLSPYIDGVSKKPISRQKLPTPEQAVQNHSITQAQRQLERSIRNTKQKMDTAKSLGDEVGYHKYQRAIRMYQDKIRELINQNDFLYRDYQRERVGF